MIETSVFGMASVKLNPTNEVDSFIFKVQYSHQLLILEFMESALKEKTICRKSYFENQISVVQLYIVPWCAKWTVETLVVHAVHQ